jgi:DNA invertase Pin-like site-specific DNA recombinase
MKHFGKFICYYRVSTQKQGKSGLGIEAQRAAVETYLNGGKWQVVAEFTEVESGKRSDRPELEKALAACRLHRAALVVSKVDRLTRSVAFLSRLLEAGVDVRFADLPQIEGAQGRFLLTQMVAVAELERGLISARTKAALARSTKTLGGDRGVVPSKAVRQKAYETLRARSAARAADLKPVFKELREANITKPTAIARALNGKGIPTARGDGEWSSTQVVRILAALGD